MDKGQLGPMHPTTSLLAFDVIGLGGLRRKEDTDRSGECVSIG
jgi:hypothetical protein